MCVAAGVAAIGAAASAQEAGAFFQDNCAMCHTIGGGSAMAPDLKDVSRRRTHEWLVHFILNPEDAAKADATAAALVKQFGGVVMPTIDGATPQVVEAVLRFVDAQSAAAPGGASASGRLATAADLAAGRELYLGRRRLAQGGPACVSCHSLAPVSGLGGGRLAPDLTLSARRLGRAPGLSNWLSNPPTGVMRAVFRARPLTADETFALAAALDDAGAHETAARRQTAAFSAYGVALACAALAAIGFIWNNRMRGVRRPMVDAARGRTGDRQ